MKDFRNKVVVITGAGSGIGRSLAINFSALGAKLALNDKNSNSLKETIKLLPKNNEVYFSVFDVSNKTAVFKFAKNVQSKFGRVDVVINNAGVGMNKFRTDEVSIEDYEWIIANNLWGVVYGSLAFLPILRKQKESSLVNISSAFGLYGAPGQAPYSTTKFAVRGFTESLELEETIHKTGVSVSCVYPGGVKTNIAKSSRGADLNPETIRKFEKTYYTSPDTAAEIIIRGIKNKRSRILVGYYSRVFHFAANRLRFLLKRYLMEGYRRL